MRARAQPSHLMLRKVFPGRRGDSAYERGGDARRNF